MAKLYSRALREVSEELDRAMAKFKRFNVIIRRLGTNPEPHEIVSQIGTGSWEEGFNLYS